MLLESRYLLPNDVKLPNEAATTQVPVLTLDSGRIQPIIDEAIDFKENPLQDYIDHLAALVATADVDNLVDELDDLITGIRGVFIGASRFGSAQTGIGFVYQWHQSMLDQLLKKVAELRQRLQQKREQYLELRDDYLDALGSSTDDELFALLHRLELKIATRSTSPLPASPADYFTDINDIRFPLFETLLDTDIVNLLGERRLTHLIKGIQAVAVQTANFDLIGIEIDDQIHQVGIFADDLQVGAENLSQELSDRSAAAQALIDDVKVSADAVQNVNLVINAGKAMFGDNFVMVPEFGPAGSSGNRMGQCPAGLRTIVTLSAGRRGYRFSAR